MNPDLSLFSHKSRIQKRWRDHDEYRHVNNSVYLTYLEEARIHYFHEAYQWNWQKEGIILARVEIDFVKPVTYTEPTWVYTRVAKIGGKSFLMNYLLVNEYEDRKEVTTRATSLMVMFDYKNNETYPVPDPVREKFLAYEQPGSIEL